MKISESRRRYEHRVGSVWETFGRYRTGKRGMKQLNNQPNSISKSLLKVQKLIAKRSRLLDLRVLICKDLKNNKKTILTRSDVY